MNSYALNDDLKYPSIKSISAQTFEEEIIKKLPFGNVKIISFIGSGYSNYEDYRIHTYNALNKKDTKYEQYSNYNRIGIKKYTHHEKTFLLVGLFPLFEPGNKFEKNQVLISSYSMIKRINAFFLHFSSYVIYVPESFDSEMELLEGGYPELSTGIQHSKFASVSAINPPKNTKNITFINPTDYKQIILGLIYKMAFCNFHQDQMGNYFKNQGCEYDDFFTRFDYLNGGIYNNSNIVMYDSYFDKDTKNYIFNLEFHDPNSRVENVNILQHPLNKEIYITIQGIIIDERELEKRFEIFKIIKKEEMNFERQGIEAIFKWEEDRSEFESCGIYRIKIIHI